MGRRGQRSVLYELVFGNLRNKGTALLLALVIWGMTFGSSLATKTIEVDVNITTPNQDQVVTTLPNTASAANPRGPTCRSQRACRIKAFHRTIIIAPFSFGSQPQNLPQLSSAQRPPRTVPMKLKKIAKQIDPYVMRYKICWISADCG